MNGRRGQVGVFPCEPDDVKRKVCCGEGRNLRQFVLKLLGFRNRESECQPEQMDSLSCER